MHQGGGVWSVLSFHRHMMEDIEVKRNSSKDNQTNDPIHPSLHRRESASYRWRSRSVLLKDSHSQLGSQDEILQDFHKDCVETSHEIEDTKLWRWLKVLRCLTRTSAALSYSRTWPKLEASLLSNHLERGVSCQSSWFTNLLLHGLTHWGVEPSFPLILRRRPMKTWQ